MLVKVRDRLLVTNLPQKICRLCKAVVLMFCFAGCAAPKLDYAISTGTQVAHVKVTMPIKTVNSLVLIHGDDICDAQEARLAARLTNWDAIGVKKSDAIFDVPADQSIAISVPIMITDPATSDKNYSAVNIYTQPVVTFTPKQGEFYEIEFSQFNVMVYTLDSGKPNAKRSGVYPSHLDKSCKITNTNQRTDKLQFYLTTP